MNPGHVGVEDNIDRSRDPQRISKYALNKAAYSGGLGLVVYHRSKGGYEYRYNFTERNIIPIQYLLSHDRALNDKIYASGIYCSGNTTFFLESIVNAHIEVKSSDSYRLGIAHLWKLSSLLVSAFLF